jgi:hypothetical protein
MAEVKKLGELLIEAGLIDAFQLETALAQQRNWGGKIGTVLVELGFVKEDDVTRVIADKLRIPHANLFDPPIAEPVLKLIKQDIAKKYTVLPVRKEGGAVLLAMADPLDIAAIDELRFITGLNIKPALALESEIKIAIKKYYDHEEVTRPQRVFMEPPGTSTAKMEIIRGSDLTMPKAEAQDPSSAILSREETVQQSLQDNKIRVDALISLLIEKGIISRDDLVSMIYQKKMGL